MTTGSDQGNAPPHEERSRGGHGTRTPSPPQTTTPIMGIPGQSAFAPYIRPPPPPPPPCASPGSHSGLIGSGSGLGFASGIGFHGARAVPVAGGGYGAAAVGLRIGGNPVVSRKRGRDGGQGGNQAEGGGNPVNCSVCRKVFMSPKALFGHMRSHPDRGWKGAHPPPSFSAEEEFADLRGLNPAPEGGPADAVEEGGNGGGAEEMEAAAEAEGPPQKTYRLPDLNM